MGFLSALTGPVGSLAGSLLGYSSARQANKTNVNLANTQYQRQANDLEKAGLNRILGYAKGVPTPPVQVQPRFKASDFRDITTGMKSLSEKKNIESQTEINKIEKQVRERVFDLTGEQVIKTEKQVRALNQQYQIQIEQLKQAKETTAQAKSVTTVKLLEQKTAEIELELMRALGIGTHHGKMGAIALTAAVAAFYKAVESRKPRTGGMNINIHNKGN